MIRLLLPIIALPLALTTAAGSNFPAGDPSALNFSLWEARDSGDIDASFSGYGRGRNQWTSSFTPAQLAGLDLAGFRGSGAHPVRFALNRESGRLECAGSGGSGAASGRCGFAPDATFGAALAGAQVSAPDPEQWLDLFAVDVHRDLLAAVRAAGYPPPSVEDLIDMSAVGVDGPYIRALAAAGYRPDKLETLVELRAVGVTPEWIGGLARIGLGRLRVDDLTELKALGVDADFVQGFRAAGYPDLSADELVELKAVGVTPEFARAVEHHMGRQSVDRLVELKAVGFAWRD